MTTPVQPGTLGPQVDQQSSNQTPIDLKWGQRHVNLKPAWHQTRLAGRIALGVITGVLALGAVAATVGSAFVASPLAVGMVGAAALGIMLIVLPTGFKLFAHKQYWSDPVYRREQGMKAAKDILKNNLSYQEIRAKYGQLIDKYELFSTEQLGQLLSGDANGLDYGTFVLKHGEEAVTLLNQQDLDRLIATKVAGEDEDGPQASSQESRADQAQIVSDEEFARMVAEGFEGDYLPPNQPPEEPTPTPVPSSPPRPGPSVQQPSSTEEPDPIPGSLYPSLSGLPPIVIPPTTLGRGASAPDPFSGEELFPAPGSLYPQLFDVPPAVTPASSPGSEPSTEEPSPGREPSPTPGVTTVLSLSEGEVDTDVEEPSVKPPTFKEFVEKNGEDALDGSKEQQDLFLSQPLADMLSPKGRGYAKKLKLTNQDVDNKVLKDAEELSVIDFLKLHGQEPFSRRLIGNEKRGEMKVKLLQELEKMSYTQMMEVRNLTRIVRITPPEFRAVVGKKAKDLSFSEFRQQIGLEAFSFLGQEKKSSYRKEFLDSLKGLSFHELEGHQKDMELLDLDRQVVLESRWEKMPIAQILRQEKEAFLAEYSKTFSKKEWQQRFAEAVRDCNTLDELVTLYGEDCFTAELLNSENKDVQRLVAGALQNSTFDNKEDVVPVYLLSDVVLAIYDEVRAALDEVAQSNRSELLAMQIEAGDDEVDGDLIAIKNVESGEERKKVAEKIFQSRFRDLLETLKS